MRHRAHKVSWSAVEGDDFATGWDMGIGSVSGIRRRSSAHAQVLEISPRGKNVSTVMAKHSITYALPTKLFAQANKIDAEINLDLNFDLCLVNGSLNGMRGPGKGAFGHTRH